MTEKDLMRSFSVKFLVDVALSADLAAWLRSLGHDAVHASELQLSRAPDSQILSNAFNENGS